MILPIVAYGSQVLRRVAQPVSRDFEFLDEVISNLFETMYHADGVGLAAPQVSVSLRLFVVDASAMKENHPEADGFKKAFINPEIIERSEEEVLFNEGCLSIPGLHEEILRPAKIRIKYFDENFVEHIEYFDKVIARIIQHEYDHLEGILFPDKLTHFKRRVLKGKLTDISKGKTDAAYKMNFPIKRK